MNSLQQNISVLQRLVGSFRYARRIYDARSFEENLLTLCERNKTDVKVLRTPSGTYVQFPKPDAPNSQDRQHRVRP